MPPPVDRRPPPSRRFYLPAVLLAVAGLERSLAPGLPAGVRVLGVVLLLAGGALAVVVAVARRR